MSRFAGCHGINKKRSQRAIMSHEWWKTKSNRNCCFYLAPGSHCGRGSAGTIVLTNCTYFIVFLPGKSHYYDYQIDSNINIAHVVKSCI